MSAQEEAIIKFQDEQRSQAIQRIYNGSIKRAQKLEGSLDSRKRVIGEKFKNLALRARRLALEHQMPDPNAKLS